MKPTIRRFAALIALLAFAGASSVLAQRDHKPPMPSDGPPPPAMGGLMLIDEEGNEVLRLEPGQMTTELQEVPEGRYMLMVEGAGAFKMMIGGDTEIEVKRAMEEPPPPAGKRMMPPAGDSPAVIDFDLEAGDQMMRMAPVKESGEKVELQLTAFDLPEFYGWSAVIEYDPEQIELVGNSFKPSSFIPGLIPLVDDQEGKVEVGGANFSKKVSSGDGDLGTLAFETLDDFSGHAELKLVELKVRKLDGTNIMEADAIAIISGMHGPGGPGGPPPADEEPEMEILAGKGAIDHLMAEGECAGCDLSGANLMRKDLEEADLSGANLTKANLFGAKLGSANLKGAILVETNLLQADLREAILIEVDLTKARVIGAKLQKADLTDAILEGTKLSGANLINAIWVDGEECGRGSIGRCKK
jgi:uncharacterized protein YjbI with pentapeptide repeats